MDVSSLCLVSLKLRCFAVCTRSPSQFHIYAVGTEECQNSIAKSVIVHSKREWENLLKETLGASYEMLCGHALQASGDDPSFTFSKM